jgi:hypothetical protein
MNSNFEPSPLAPKKPKRIAFRFSVVVCKFRRGSPLLARCVRMDKAALDFVCLEKVKEESNTRKGPVGTAVMPGYDIWGRSVGTATKSAPPDNFNTLTSFYNYMYVRKGATVTEKRDLLKKNGEEIEQENARITTRHFKFNDIFSGPSMLFGEAAAAEHEYKFIENDKIKREPVIVVSCEAKPGRDGKPLAGEAWVRVKDGAVLRIEWDPSSFSGYKEVEAIAEELGMNPSITSETEFGIERNGIRFPTRDRTEETYKKGSMTFTRSTVTVTYDDYKFFIVETGVEIR